MKFSKFILICLALFLATQSIAQPENDDEKFYVGRTYEGYILRADGQRVNGFIQYQAAIPSQDKVFFWADKNDRKTKTVYKPKDIKGYHVAGKTWITVPYGLMASNLFLERAMDGHIAVYDYYFVDDETKELTNNTVLQKGDEKPINTARFIMFAKNMSKYVSDHKELAKKVKNKEKGYRLLQMYDIIEEYNEWYAENNK